MVCARSAEEIPVVMPYAASTATVMAVEWGEVLWRTIIGMPSRSRSSPSMGTQIKPRPLTAMKVIASDVASSAAMTKSPSFSRSSSSTMITSPPERTRSIASSTESAASGLMLEGSEVIEFSGRFIARRIARCTCL